MKDFHKIRSKESVVTEAKVDLDKLYKDIDDEMFATFDSMTAKAKLNPKEMEYILAKLSKEMTGQHKDYVKKAKNFKESAVVTEAKVTVNVDWMGDVRDPDTSKVLKKYKIKAKEKGNTADLTGDSKDVAKYLQAVHHAGEYKTVQDLLDDGLYSELEESVVTESRYTVAMENLYERIEKLADDLAALGKKDKANKREIDSIVKTLDTAAIDLINLVQAQMESVEVTEAGIEDTNQPGANNVVVAYSSLTNKDIAQWRKDIKEFNTLFRDSYNVDAVLNATKVAQNSMSKWEKKFKKSDTR